MYHYFNDRTIVETFYLASKKQQLHPKVIDKLMKCVTNIEDFIEKNINERMKTSTSNYIPINVNHMLQYFAVGIGGDLNNFMNTERPVVDYFVKNFMEKVGRSQSFLDTLTQINNYNPLNTLTGASFFSMIRNFDLILNKITDKDGALKLLREDLNKFRLSAISAVYRCASRNKHVLTEERIKILEKCLSWNDEFDDFKEKVFDLICLAESNSGFDYKTIFNKFIQQLNDMTKTMTKSSHCLKIALNFIKEQSKDYKRSNELFTSQVLDDLINALLNSKSLGDELKEYLIDIINNYLEHEANKGLIDSQMESLLRLIGDKEINNFEIKNGACRLILATIQKNNHASNNVVSELIQNIDCNLNEKFSNLIIIIVSQLLDAKTCGYLKNENDLEKISQKLSYEKVIVEYEDDLHFEEPSESNQDCVYLATLAAKILKNSLENKILLNEPTIENLLSTLKQDNANKHTKIYASECIYLLSLGDNLGIQIIDEIGDYLTKANADDNVDDMINDVSVYLHRSYCKSLEFLTHKESEEPLGDVHLRNLCTLFKFDGQTLKINEIDYSRLINSTSLKILRNEAAKKKFEQEQVFNLIEYVLGSSNEICYMPLVLGILKNYTKKGYELPESTIIALDHANFHESSHLIFRNIILNGQQVTNRILQMLLDDLFVPASESRRRYNSFKLLEIARRNNQDLPDNVFDNLELARAGFQLSRKGSLVINKHAILSYINEQTDMGKRLPHDTLNALGHVMEYEEVLKILMNISKNKQVIYHGLLSKVMKIFENTLANLNDKTNEKASNLIKIFENMVKNNQKLPNELLKQLENSLEIVILEENSLSIFVYLTHKGELLNVNIVNKILNKIIRLDDADLFKHDCLNSVSSILQNMKSITSINQDKLEQILLNGIKSKNINIKSLTINTLKTFVSLSFKCNNCIIHELVNQYVNEKCNHIHKKHLGIVLDEMMKQLDTYDSFRTDKSLMIKIQLANIKSKSNDEYLAKLETVISNQNMLEHVVLLETNCYKLKEIIEKDTRLQSKVLHILQMSQNKCAFSSQLMESLATLFESTASKDVKKDCLNIFRQIKEEFRNKNSLNLAKNDEKSRSNLIKILNNEETFRMVAEYCVGSTEREIFKKGQLCQEMMQKLELNMEKLDNLIDELINIMHTNKEFFELSLIEDLDELTDILVNENPNFFNCEPIVDFIERCLLFNDDNSAIGTKLKIEKEYFLKKYSQIIKNGIKTDRVRIFEIILTRIIESSLNSSELNEKENLLLGLTECILNMIEYAHHVVSEKTLLEFLNFLQNNLESRDKLIRRATFRGTRLGIFKVKMVGFSFKYFLDWCEKISNNLSITLPGKIEDNLELLEIIVSLDHINLAVFTECQRNEWIRELIISDIFEKCEKNKSNQIDFYKSCFEFEKKNSKNPAEILFILSQKADHFSSLKQISDTLLLFAENHTDSCLTYLKDLDFSNDENEKDLHEILKIKWIISLIQNKLLNSKIDEVYLNKFVARNKIFKKNNFNFISKLFNCIGQINDVKDLDDLLEFCWSKQIQEDDLLFENLPAEQLLQLLQMKYLSNKLTNLTFNHSFEDYTYQLAKLFSTLKSLFKKNWPFEQLNEIINSIKSFNLRRKTTEYTLSILNILDQLNFPVDYFASFLECLKQADNITDALQKLNILAIQNNYKLRSKIGDPKNSHELLDQLIELNSNQQSLKSILIENRRMLENCIVDIKNDDLYSKILVSCNLKISEWTQKQIVLWARIVKKNPYHLKDLIETIAVLKHANYLATGSGYHLTDTQIICSLISLHQNFEDKTFNRGKLLQVATGEGKSTIICLLAIVSALKGHKVDVITSSPVLAERDAKDKAQLFKMFELSSSDNNDRSTYIKGAKECYNCDIVYGELSQFQFDKLRDDYSQLGTLANRVSHIAIVDEVDSMLIDDSTKIARLSSTAAGMDHFYSIYYFIWQQILNLKEKFILLDNQMFMMNGKLGFEDGKITLEYADKNNDIKIIQDLNAYVYQNNGQISDEIGKQIDSDKKIEDYIKETISSYLDGLIKDDGNPQNKLNDKGGSICIPKCFHEFFIKQKSKWINNAIEAMNYQKDIQYLVQDGQIKPVDYISTGIVQSSTNWSDGLHQFLQIKHNQRLTSESFTTNFISNTGYFKNGSYEKIYGLTGTLGSNKARQILKEVYSVQLIEVPQSRHKQYIEYETIILQNESKWLQEICFNAILEAKKMRGILVICETIEHTFIISEELKNKYRRNTIKLYTMNNMNQEKQIENVLPGEIIIATNLVGRGTDIKTNEIEDYGGLHVIVTFMPNNQRVEEQAFGRTARQGKRGTGQMILNSMTFISIGIDDNNKFKKISLKQLIKQQRDKIEAEFLDEFQKNDLKLIETKDKLFKMFSSFLNRIRNDIREKSGIWRNFKSKLSIVLTPTVYETNVLAAIEEKWAQFLRNIDDIEIIKLNEAEDMCQKLIDKLLQDYNQSKLINNPFYLISIANDYFVNQQDYVKALDYYEKAIVSDANFSAAAYVGKVNCLVKLQNNPNSLKNEVNKLLMIAIDKLTNQMSLLTSMQTILQEKQEGFFNSDLYKQLLQKSTILGSYLNSIQTSMNVVKKSLRLIDLTIAKDSKNEIPEKVELIFDLERDAISKKLTGINLEDSSIYDIVFNDLTRREDCGIIDQALITIGNASSLNLNSDQMYVKLRPITGEKLKALFDPNIEIQEATKEAAEAKLKELSSIFERYNITSSEYQINMQIIDLNNTNESNEKKDSINEYSQKSVYEILNIIKTNKLDSLRFNLQVLKGNKTSSYLCEKVLNRGACLNVEFSGLDITMAKKKIDQIHCKKVNIEIRDTKEKLLKLKEVMECTKLVTFTNPTKKIIERLSVKAALERINKLSDQSRNLANTFERIKLESLDASKITIILDICNDPETASFNIEFLNIEPIKCLVGLEDSAQVNVCFENLNKQIAEDLINKIREENLDFILSFKRLTRKEVEFIVTNANLDQEKLEIIKKAKKLSDLFAKSSIPKQELIELASIGIEFTLEINEKRFIPWRSIIAVAVLGTLQIIAGALLICTGFGASVGMGLITEGMADMFTAYRAYSTRQFNWKDYLAQKAVSLLISCVSIGFGKIKVQYL